MPLNGLTTPDILYWPMSGKIVFFTVLGGFRNFTGPIVGAVGYNYLEVFAVSKTEYWQFLLGSVLIALVLFMPGGLVGALSRFSGWLKSKVTATEEKPEPAPRKQTQPGD